LAFVRRAVTLLIGAILIVLVWLLTVEWKTFVPHEYVGLSTGSKLVFVLAIGFLYARVLPTVAYVGFELAAKYLLTGGTTIDRLFGLLFSTVVGALVITAVILVFEEPVFNMLFALIIKSDENAGGNFYEALNMALLTIAITETPRVLYAIAANEWKRDREDS
jgi:uncharacterized membrane protein required for colicin V production